MLKRFKNSYYSKIMVICIAAVCIITAVVLPLCSSLIHRQERSEDLKNYDLTLNSLASSFASRQDTLAVSLTPLFADSKSYDALCGLYRYHSKKVPAEYGGTVSDLLSSVCFSDPYCCGALLLTVTGHLYQYNSVNGTLVPLTLRALEEPLTHYKLQIFTDSQLNTLSMDLEKPTDRLYGISTSVFDEHDGTVDYLGALIFLYSASEYENLIASAGLFEESTFTLLDAQKNVIFSSDNAYASSDGLLLNEHLAETVSQASFSGTLLGEPYYASTLYNSRYDFYTAYQIPSSLFTHSDILRILTVLSVCICLAAILLYLIAFRISDRKIHSIQQGMSLVGMNNLNYRLPVPKGNDEFTQITRSFNRMCDALQRNVEKAYLYEIAQRKAELYAMQTSINPHFLYNAFEQIRVQILQGGYADASQMLLLLSRMYRNQTRRNLYITVAEECSQSENLINFYMYRYGDFEYEFDIHSSVKLYGIPKNTLQPLIENFFVHGFIPDSDENLLTISAQPLYRNGDLWISICVEDNGGSISEEDLALLKEKLSSPVLSRSEDNGFALSNVNHRLRLVFGEESGLKPGIGKGGRGFAVRFSIPAVLPDDLQKA